ncbi:YbaB/EbfC family DNA-binding protein [Mycobacterium sp.]|jgi:hypothetical protein|uniref:YbaB/EbfC family DNA-binding protein n=1 Tax=Mycobacterium sp. TaxID=1785 RepID=UPI002C8D7946|nr:YbaB/EbfC family DNA-binding protein [Mycobacterium sp.]HXB85881.1 YbaB/EbfC family DNA-binding protein [Mycobacterium sp.]
MVDRTPPYEPQDDDDHDDLAALDFSVADDGAEGSVLDAFDDYVRAAETEDTTDDLLPLGAAPGESEELAPALFRVTNPPGTVSVSAHMDGRVQQIELTTKATNMTESQLADEILVIADLARQKARSAQYASMLEGMRDLGHDNASTRDFLGRDLDLPSPEEATAAAAEVFATRYAGEDD